MRRHLARMGLVSLLGVALAGTLGFASCTQNGDPAGTPCQSSPAASVQGTEWVSFHTEVPLAPATFHPLASGLFGSDAQAGKLVKDRQLTEGYFVSSAADTSTPDQTQLTFAFDDSVNPRHTLAIAPASFSLGTIFIAAVDAALATMQAEEAMQKGSSEQFFLEYRVTSAMGGKLSFGVRGNLGVYSLVLDVTSPHTTLEPGKLGTPAEQYSPHDSVAGTVWFHLSKDEFDFFSNHAYGLGATTEQNFSDFALVPHEWLHLTVTPHLDQQFVNVAFDVVTAGKQRIPVAQAPASTLAGSTFQKMVDRNVTTMLAQEKAKAGSSSPWQVPFYYDQPSGGGVVQVIAQSNAGAFEIAYAIESPQHPLSDVAFVPYQPVSLPTSGQAEACQKLGNPNIVVASAGTLDATFIASSTILTSPDLKKPLKATIYCSVFHAADVMISGPVSGAVSLQDFKLVDADLQSKTAPTFKTRSFAAGDYQILCFQDLAGNGNASHGDPVTLPVGGYTIACNENPVTVEFAILDPQ